MNKRTLQSGGKLIIGIAISAGCAYMAFRGISTAELKTAFSSAEWKWFVPTSVLYALAFLLRATRWRAIVSSLKKGTLGDFYSTLMVGYLCNNILPFRLGEFIRARLAGVRLELPMTTMMGTIVVERLFDAASFLGVFLLTTTFLPFPSSVKRGAGVMFIGVLIGVIGILVALRWTEPVMRMLQKLPLPSSLKQTIISIIRNILEGLRVIRSARIGITIILLSLFIWTTEATVIALASKAFAGAGLNLLQAFFLMFFLGLAVSVPQGPGYIGTIELFGTAALSNLGIPKSASLPFIIGLHGFQVSFIVLIGAISAFCIRKTLLAPSQTTTTPPAC